MKRVRLSVCLIINCLVTSLDLKLADYIKSCWPFILAIPDIHCWPVIAVLFFFCFNFFVTDWVLRCTADIRLYFFDKGLSRTNYSYRMVLISVLLHSCIHQWNLEIILYDFSFNQAVQSTLLGIRGFSFFGGKGGEVNSKENVILAKNFRGEFKLLGGILPKKWSLDKSPSLLQ